MKWWWSKAKDHDGVTEEPMGLAEARAQRVEAERRLRESLIAARQVRLVSIVARRIRADNQFSDRLNQVFGSRPQNG